MIVKMIMIVFWGHPLKNYGGFVLFLQVLQLHNYMADSAIILYSVCLVCLSSHFEKLGQSDLDKKIKIKICRNSKRI